LELQIEFLFGRSPQLPVCCRGGAAPVVAGERSAVDSQAVAGPAAVDHLNRVDGIVRALAAKLNVKQDELPERVAGEGA
jgi:hypothetical protein